MCAHKREGQYLCTQILPSTTVTHKLPLFPTVAITQGVAFNISHSVISGFARDFEVRSKSKVEIAFRRQHLLSNSHSGSHIFADSAVKRKRNDCFACAGLIAHKSASNVWGHVEIETVSVVLLALF